MIVMSYSIRFFLYYYDYSIKDLYAIVSGSNDAVTSLDATEAVEWRGLLPCLLTGLQPS